MSWYDQYKQISTSLLAALMMVSHGYSIESSAEANDVSVDDVRRVLEEHSNDTAEMNNTNNVSMMDIVNTIIQLEGASETFIGPSNDTGVMQMLPGTWEEMNRRYYGGKLPYSKYKFNRRAQIIIGRQYVLHISNWLDRYKNMWKASKSFLIFATYNGGMGNVKRNAFDAEVIKKNLPSVYDYAERGCNLTGESIK